MHQHAASNCIGPFVLHRRAISSRILQQPWPTYTARPGKGKEGPDARARNRDHARRDPQRPVGLEVERLEGLA